MRRIDAGVVIAALVVAVTTPVLVATPAEATAYRYWSYWHETDSGWTFSQIGATGAHPKDGTVEGWRFAVSPGTASAPAPRVSAAAAFSSICGSTPAESGKKRVALAVDFGVRGDAPSGDNPPSYSVHGSCVVLRPAGTGWDVLVAAGYDIRSNDSMVCGLSGYPSRGCGEVVADPKPQPSSSSRPTTAAPNPPSGDGSGSGGRNGSGSGSGAKGGGTDDGDGTDDSARTSTPSPTGTATSSASAAASATSTGIPSADALDPSSPQPSLVVGAPAADTSGSSTNPLLAVIGIALVAVIAGAGLVRARRARRGQPS